MLRGLRDQANHARSPYTPASAAPPHAFAEPALRGRAPLPRAELRFQRPSSAPEAELHAKSDGYPGGSVAGEAGHLRETGNLVFHLAVVVVLVAVATGSLFGYRATVLVPEGSGFANSVIQYDGLSSGALFDAEGPAAVLPRAGRVRDAVRRGRTAARIAGRVRGDRRFTPEPGAPSRPARSA